MMITRMVGRLQIKKISIAFGRIVWIEKLLVVFVIMDDIKLPLFEYTSEISYECRKVTALIVKRIDKQKNIPGRIHPSHFFDFNDM